MCEDRNRHMVRRHFSFSPSLLGSILGASLLLAGCSELRARFLYDQAVEEGSKGNWEEAIHSLQKVWIEEPQSSYAEQAKWKAMEIYAGPLSQPDAARYLARELILHARDFSTRKKAMERLVELLRSSQRQGEAAALLEAFLASARERREEVTGLLLTLAHLYLQRGALPDAARTLKELEGTTLAPQEHREYLLLMGELHSLEGDPKGAEPFYREALSLAPSGSQEWILAGQGLAHALETLGRYREALALLEEIQPHHPNAMVLTAWIHRLEGMAQGATAGTP